MMFNAELTTVMAIFSFIAALVVYIHKRSKRSFKVKPHPLNIKKMPGTQDISASGAPWEEWNFPRTPEGVSEPLPAEMTPVQVDSGGTMPFQPQEVLPAIKDRQHDQSVLVIKAKANDHSLQAKQAFRPRVFNRSQLRESIVTMTVLGPCRALEPFGDVTK